jgi:protein transport protein SEC24
MDSQAAVPPSAAQHGKRRQYAAGQTQAYYGSDGLGAGGAGGAGYVDQNYGMGGQAQQPAQLFTPGLAGPDQFAAQQQQQPMNTQGGYYGGQQPEPEYINAPGFGQQPVDQLTNQFGQMGMQQPGMAQRPFQLYTTNLLTTPPEPRDLHRPPPEIRLPPNASISPSPTANADVSYQRCTLNAIPTTSTLLNKSKLPLALVLTPYRSLDPGDEPVPVVTDTVIARCRRCRTYINPYVTFIDGGNRQVGFSLIWNI